MVRIILCPKCGLIKEHRAKGFCQSCYSGWYHYYFVMDEETRLKNIKLSNECQRKRYREDPEFRKTVAKNVAIWNKKYAATIYKWEKIGIRIKIHKENKELYLRELKKTEEETYERILENIGDILESM